MANLFFTCPTHQWGMFILSITVALSSGLFIDLSPDAVAMLNMVGGLLALAWSVFSVYRLIWRNEKCERVGFGKKYGNFPWSSAPSAEDQKARMDAISALETPAE